MIIPKFFIFRFHVLNFELCTIAGPQKAPTDISAPSWTSKMLGIHWKKPKDDPCTVEVIAYDVLVVIFDKVHGEFRYIRNRTKTSSFNITDVRPNCVYNVTVRGRTVAGAGPFSTSYTITFTPAECTLRKCLAQKISFELDSHSDQRV